MDSRAARELLIHAMAFREKATAATLECDGDDTARRTLAEAEALLARVRTALTAYLEWRAAALRTAIETPGGAGNVEPLRKEIAAMNGLLRAKRADQLGPFVDLPLGAYPGRVHALAAALGITLNARAPRAPGAGHRRFTIAGIDILPTRRGFAVWLIGMGLAWAVPACYLGVFWPFREVTMTASVIDARGTVQVSCRNLRTSTVTLWLPETPDNAPNGSSADYAIALYARGKDGQDYHPLPPVPDAWNVMGQPLHEATPVAIGPFLSTQCTLDPGRIREITGVSFARLRLVLNRAGGGVAAACEIDAPGTPAR